MKMPQGRAESHVQKPKGWLSESEIDDPDVPPAEAGINANGEAFSPEEVEIANRIGLPPKE